ncbi:MAG TPA: transcriptional regulator, partial [Halomonas sp.]|nr:transcriptional regulator [Halomonas sp.]
MHRSVLPYLWPITTGLLLAAVLLLAFPEQLPNPFRQTPPAAVETPPALVPTTSNEQSTNRPAPDIRQAEPLARNQGPASYSDAVNQAAPAVVNIYSSRIVERDQHPLMSDPFFRQFFSGDDA